jgi:hypothetical protein
MITRPVCWREVMAIEEQKSADEKLEIECPFPFSRKNTQNANRTVDKHKLHLVSEAFSENNNTMWPSD